MQELFETKKTRGLAHEMQLISVLPLHDRQF